MNVVFEPQIWLRALAGGAMIGLAASTLLLFNGRIAGISSILGGLVLHSRLGDRWWRALFLIGLVVGALLLSLIGAATASGPSPFGWFGMLSGGLLVGFGTRLGSGCTSGHGVCGLARLSKRSMAATLTFMFFGFLTVFILRHIWKLA